MIGCCRQPVVLHGARRQQVVAAEASRLGPWSAHTPPLTLTHTAALRQRTERRLPAGAGEPAPLRPGTHAPTPRHRR